MNLKQPMSILTLATYVALSAVSPGAHAQTSPDSGQPAAQDNGADLAARVKQALDADSTLYARHIDVSMEKGKVLMTGFVGSSADMHKALQAAHRVAGEKNVRNQLKIRPKDDTTVSPSS